MKPNIHDACEALDSEVSRVLTRGHPVAFRVYRYIDSVNLELSSLDEQIAMYQQNERAYAIREKELQDQNDALRSANSSIHTARLDSLTDIQNLKEQVRKLAMDVQGLMNPVEIIDAPDCFNPTCECNSRKWERHNAAQKVTHPTATNGYGVVLGRPRDGD